MSKKNGLEEMLQWLVKAKQYGEVRARETFGRQEHKEGRPANALVVVGTHLDLVSVAADERASREQTVRKSIMALHLGWELVAVEEVALSSGSSDGVGAMAQVREVIVKAASKLDCMGNLVDASVTTKTTATKFSSIIFSIYFFIFIFRFELFASLFFFVVLLLVYKSPG